MLNKYFDQLEVGETWTSRGRTITESDIVMFAAFTGDWYPLHTDKEWAAETQFKARIAHGMLVLAVSSGLWQITPGVVVAFYGMDKVRFVGPTFIGDTIHVESEVIEKTERGHEGLATFQNAVKNQRGETVLIATMKVLLNKSR